MATAVNPQNGPVVIPSGTLVIPPQQPFRHLRTFKRLAVTQLVIGILTLIFGIAILTSLYSNPKRYNISHIAAGIWAGVWIVITGIIGVCSVRRSDVSNINGIYMTFSIISTVLSGTAVIIFAITIIIYSYQRNNGEVGVGLHIPPLILVIIEFFVSITAAVFTCQRCCCRNNQAGIIIQASQPMSVITSTAPGQPGTTYYQMVPPGAQVIDGHMVGGGQVFGGAAMVNGGQVVSGGYLNSQPPPYSSVDQPTYVQAQHSMQTDVTYSEKPPIG